MKDELAEELLGEIMEWNAEDLALCGPTLQALARLKYDEYGSFRPGEHFLESLARWLWQFEEPEERRTAIEFVLTRLVFISDAELEHAIDLGDDHAEARRFDHACQKGSSSGWAVGRRAALA